MIKEVLAKTTIYVVIYIKYESETQLYIAKNVFDDVDSFFLLKYIWFYVKLFSECLTAETSIKNNTKHKIELLMNSKSSYKLIYSQFMTKLKELCSYIEKVRKKEWIQES